jgi:hypothetical protein
VGRSHELCDLVLYFVRVLVFVDQDIVERR